MARSPAKQIEHALEEAIEINKTRKAGPSLEEAIVDLVKMVTFLNEHRGYWAADYTNEVHFKDSALGQLLSKHAK